MGEKNVERFIKEGEHVRVQVLKLDWEANRISLGIKQLVDDPFQSVASDIVEGAEVTGRVTKLMEFGAFVEVARASRPGAHLRARLAPRRQRGDVLKQDEIINVRVLKIDPDTRRISLSIKQTKERPQAPRAASPPPPARSASP